MKRIMIKQAMTHYRNPKFNVEMFACELQVSTRYLYEISMKFYDLCPKDLIECLRVGYATRLLSAPGDQPMNHIAKASGFSDTRALNRALKRHFGATSCQCKALFKQTGLPKPFKRKLMVIQERSFPAHQA